MDDELPQLPALRSLGKLADLRPVVVVDSREQTPLVFTRLPSVVAGLFQGDYSFVGGELLFAVERKSIPDFVSCCMNSNRERFENELSRLRGLRFRRLVLVGTRGEIERAEYRSQISPKAVLATLETFQIRYDIPAYFFPTPEEAAHEVEKWVWYFAREICECAGTLARDNGLTQTQPVVQAPA